MSSSPRQFTHRDDTPSVTVFAPSTSVTVTIERDVAGADEIHFHAGGQGLWVARTIRRLGEHAVLCTPTGGESGPVLEALIRRDGIGLDAVRVNRATPAYVHDRRSGDRREVAENSPSTLTRHELDDLYESVLASALQTRTLVVTGRRHVTSIPEAFYARLGADVSAAGICVIGDFHGPELAAYLGSGRIDVLKVSDEDLGADGFGVGDEPEVIELMASFRERAVDNVVLTRGTKPALAILDGQVLSATTPPVSSPDHRGSGDAMTGALTVGWSRGLRGADLLRLGCGAGAASATRHGLATADARLIGELAELVTITPIERTPIERMTDS